MITKHRFSSIYTPTRTHGQKLGHVGPLAIKTVETSLMWFTWHRGARARLLRFCITDGQGPALHWVLYSES